MFFRDRPLLVDGIDAELAVRRANLEEAIVSAAVAGRNVLVIGEPGAGKSTLLRMVAAELRGNGTPAVLVNAAVAEDAYDLLGLVDDSISEVQPATLEKAPLEKASHSARLLGAARRLAREEPVVVLLDGLDEVSTAFDLFGRLRDELWSTANPWVVAVRTRDSAVLRTPPADAFWSSVIEIPQLADAEIDELLSRGLDEQEQALVRRIFPRIAGFPRTIIRDIEAALSTDVGVPTRERAERYFEMADRLGRSEAMAVAEIHGLGRPVSVRDAELLERLGWSRPYAQRILSTLEANGILRSMPERRDAPGRPRKLYELNPMLSFDEP